MSEHVDNDYVSELRRLGEHHWGPKLREIADHLEALEAALFASTELLKSLDALVDHLPRWGDVMEQIDANKAVLGGAK